MLREILQLHGAHGGNFKCFDMQGNRILSSGRARASLQPLASFPCYQRPLTHTTDVLAEGSCTTEKSGRHTEKIYKTKHGQTFPRKIS